MHFQSIVCGVFMTASLASGIFVPGDLPDGLWTGTEYPNGTTITTCLSDSTIPPVIEQHEVVPRSSIKERGSGTGGCWGYFLDPGSVDADNQAFQDSVANGQEFCSDSHNEWTGFISNSVLVYFCADENNECFYLDPGIIQQGMGLMDAICTAYEASWALFPGTGSQRFIMGKCVINSSICQ
jgi:hypothetical protein